KSYTETLTLTAAASGPTPSTAPPVGTLALAINVDGADIFVDGQLKDTARDKKAKITIAAGGHQVRVEKPGYDPTTLPVEIAEGSESPLSVALQKGTGGAVPQTTYLIVSSVPNAQVVVDGKPSGNVQPDGKASVPVDPGKHQVQVSLDGYESASKSMNAKAENRGNVALNLKAIAK